MKSVKFLFFKNRTIGAVCGVVGLEHNFLLSENLLMVAMTPSTVAPVNRRLNFDRILSCPAGHPSIKCSIGDNKRCNGQS